MKTDLQLRKDVEDQLDWDPRVDSRQIGVSVKDGVVALTGQVGTYGEWRAAQDAAQSVGGVQALANEVRVMEQPHQVRSDSDIAQAALHVLRNNVRVPLESIQLRVSAGRLTLTGQVPNWFQRDAAESALKHVRGVIGIANQIDIRPNINAGDIVKNIKAALRRHATLAARKIRVQIIDGVVTLEGDVGTLSERSAAEVAAWYTAGVRHVTDNLMVRPSIDRKGNSEGEVGTLPERDAEVVA